MRSDQIRSLLDKYHRGKTSLKEEKLLREQFLSGDYPPEFSVDAELFLCFAKRAKEWVPNPELDREVEELLRSLPSSIAWRHKRRVPWLVTATILLTGGLLFSMSHFYLNFKEAARLKEAKIMCAEAFNLMQGPMGIMNSINARSGGLKHLDNISGHSNGLSNLNTVQEVHNNND